MYCVELLHLCYLTNYFCGLYCNINNAALFTTDMTVSSVTAPADEVKTSGVEAAANDNKRQKLENPLLRSWSDQPFHLPPFADIKSSHFEPALKAGMEAHIADLGPSQRRNLIHLTRS